jgi:hypothetical protein
VQELVRQVIQNASMAFRSLLDGERFLRAILKARNNPALLRKIIKLAGSKHLKTITDLLRNLKHLPLSGREKAKFCQHRRAIKKLLAKRTSVKAKKAICCQKGKGRSTGNQVGGIFPILPAIASLGISLLTSLLSK